MSALGKLRSLIAPSPMKLLHDVIWQHICTVFHILYPVSHRNVTPQIPKYYRVEILARSTNMVNLKVGHSKENSEKI
jgi:hypothetical protein